MPIDDHTWRRQLEQTLLESNIVGLGAPRREGPADTYDFDAHQLVVCTDRSGEAIDPMGTIPFRGESLTQLSLWWYGALDDLVKNSVVRVVDQQAALFRRAEPVPYALLAARRLTGDLARAYEKGHRDGEVGLRDGLTVEQPFPSPVVAPFTRDSEKPTTWQEVVRSSGMDTGQVDRLRSLSGQVFARTEQLGRDHGVEILAARYQWGVLPDGNVTLMGLVHQPWTLIVDWAATFRCHPLAAGTVVDPNRALGEGGAAAAGLADDERLEASRVHVWWAGLFLPDFAPTPGPVANRLSLNLSRAGLSA